MFSFLCFGLWVVWVEDVLPFREGGVGAPRGAGGASAGPRPLHRGRGPRVLVPSTPPAGVPNAGLADPPRRCGVQGFAPPPHGGARRMERQRKRAHGVPGQRPPRFRRALAIAPRLSRVWAAVSPACRSLRFPWAPTPGRRALRQGVPRARPAGRREAGATFAVAGRAGEEDAADRGHVARRRGERAGTALPVPGRTPALAGPSGDRRRALRDARPEDCDIQKDGPVGRGGGERFVHG